MHRFKPHRLGSVVILSYVGASSGDPLADRGRVSFERGVAPSTANSTFGGKQHMGGLGEQGLQTRECDCDEVLGSLFPFRKALEDAG